MDEKAFQNRLGELLGQINDLPEGQQQPLRELADATRAHRDRIKASVTELQESMDYLRLSVKYLVFDLEATRRENTYLRKLVEQVQRDERPQADQGDDSFYSDGEND